MGKKTHTRMNAIWYKLQRCHYWLKELHQEVLTPVLINMWWLDWSLIVSHLHAFAWAIHPARNAFSPCSQGTLLLISQVLTYNYHFFWDTILQSLQVELIFIQLYFQFLVELQHLPHCIALIVYMSASLTRLGGLEGKSVTYLVLYS